MAYTGLLTPEDIRARLQLIFPDSTPNRAKVVTAMAARTVFVALYIDAIEGGETVLQPKPIYRMTDAQAHLTDEASRRAYTGANSGKGAAATGTRWYQDNSREGIRDDTLREGLVTLGAVVVQPGVAVTANLPRYVLSAGFAALFDPRLSGSALEEAAAAWRTSALSAPALARIALGRQGAIGDDDRVLISFPNGEARRMKPGPSAPITKAVIEVFARRYLVQPVVISISDSGEKIFELDHARAQAIGLNIQADRNLPDIILADFGQSKPLLVFVEVVASDGPIHERRKADLEQLVKEAGFPAEHVAFVTAYKDRGGGPFRKNVTDLAWGSYAWFVSEPEKLIALSEMTTRLTGQP